MAGGPTGGSVAVGSATITTPNANQTVVNQSSKKALINWTDFSVSNGSSVIFNQPNSKSLTVNRVTGPNASAIYGELLANGSIWLINANGILFGHGSQINVGALLATTSDITDDDFKKGHNNFAKASSNPDASVVNQGTITAKRGGSVVLSAAHVSNEGMIQADLGTVVLGGASAFTVDMKGDNLLRYQIAAPVTQAPKDAQGNSQSALVSNSGTISANGGTVLMTASAAKSVEDNVINNTGMVEATSVSSHNGEIDLDAGPDGTVNVGGTLDASGTAKGQAGGAINITGGTVNVADGTKINASGDAGGGTIQIGGGLHGKGTLANAQTTNVGNATITADAISKGNGGTVTVWADGSSSFSGSISAKGGAKGGNGGSVETSGGHLNVGNSATVNTSSALGLTGDWLLDPTDINIETGGGDGIGGSNIDPNTIISALGSTNVTLEANDDINVLNAILYTSANALNLLAGNYVYVTASIQNSGTGDLNVIAGWDGTTTSISDILAHPGTAYGLGVGAVYILGTSSDPLGGVAVGSKFGTTTLAGADIYVEAANGFAQAGYHGTGATGNVVVSAAGDPSATGIDTTDRGEGSDACFNHPGNVCVNSGGSPDGVFGTGGQYAQIGSGPGDASGNITVTATGNIVLTGGGIHQDPENEGYWYGVGGDTVPDTSAQIGNGDASLATVANVSGDIFVQAGGLTYLDSSTESTSYAWLGNRTGVGGSESGKVTLITGSEDEAGPIDLGDIIIADLGSAPGQGGNVTIGQTDGDAMKIDNGLFYTSANSLTVVSVGDIDVSGSFQNGGTGDITLVAGWDGKISDLGALTTSGVYSNNDGSVFIGGPDSEGSAVGSAGGTTTVAGYNVVVEADNGYAQIGYHGTGTGTINVVALDEILVQSNGEETLAQIGNGGGDVAGTGGAINVHSFGNISIEADQAQTGVIIGNLSIGGAQSGDIDVEADDGLYIGAVGDNSVAKIGNSTVPGGSGDASGAIDVDVTGGLTIESDGAQSNAQIGNGLGANDSATGDISVSTDSVNLFGYGSGSVSRIGDQTHGDANSAITVNATGDINLESADFSNAIVGNGAQGDAAGDIEVTADGGISLQAEGQASQARIGEGGNNVSGNLTVTAANDIGLYADGDNSAALISNFSLSGTITGDIGVTSTDGSVLASANGADSFAHIGLGNEVSDPSLSGNITVAADGGSVQLIGGGEGSVVQIGNGGPDSQQNSASGNITVAASGDVSLSANSDNAYIQIGNGGENADGNFSGTISITTPGGMQLSANGAADGIQIGNGGLDSNQNSATSFSNTGDITILSDGQIALNASGQDDVVSIGNGGGCAGAANGACGTDADATTNGSVLFGGNITIETPAELYLNTGDGAHVWIGNGGDGSGAGLVLNGGSLTDSGNITIATAGDPADADPSGDSELISIGVFTDGAGAVAHIGNGGENANAGASATGGIFESGALSLTAGGDSIIDLIAGNNGDAGGQTWIGNGGYQSRGSASGDITIDASGGFFESTFAGPSSVQVVNGGNSFIGDASGDILITAGDPNFAVDISVNGTGSHAQIGNGGSNTQGNDSGNITITNAVSGISVSTTGANDYAQIGNGGVNARGNSSGNISLSALNGSINVTDSGGNCYIQIGNGGDGSAGSASGDISLVAGQDIALITEASTDGGSYIQVGNGGNNSNEMSATGFSDTGNISLTASDITLETGNGNSDVQIGNGGDCAGANGASSGCGTPASVATNGNVAFGGDISITATDALSLLAEEAINGVWIGNGGDNSGAGLAITNGAFTSSGNINVAVGTDTHAGTLLMETADRGASIVFIGNGGYMSGAGATATGGITTAGDITIAVSGGGEHDGEADLLADSSQSSSTVLIGNFAQAGTVSGTINVSVDGALNLENTLDVDSALIGNVATAPATASGNVTIIAQKTDGIGASVRNDLPGGDFTLENLGTDPLVIDEDFSVASTHDLTVLSVGDIDIEGVLQNTQASGGGAITLVAGWDGTITNPASLTNAGVYGNNGGSILVGGPDAEGNSAVGSLSGLTTIEGDEIALDAENGFAQIGYHGTGGGNIVVNAMSNIAIDSGEPGEAAQIGNGGADINGTFGGSITLASFGGDVTLDASQDGSLAEIGNMGGANSSESGDIAIDTHGGALALTSEGDAAEGDPSFARIGNWTLGGTSSPISGNITINAGDVSLAATGVYSFAEIGTGTFHASDDTGALSGNIQINAATLSMDAVGDGDSDDQTRIGNLGFGAVSGDIDIATTGDITAVASGGGLASIGSVSAPSDSDGNPRQGEGSGNLVIQSGGAISLLAQDGGQARIESGGFASGDISVTANGDVTLSVNSDSDTGGGAAFIGSYASGNADVDVSVASTTGKVDLEADDDASSVQIGNIADGAPGALSGDVTVTAGNASNGNVIVSATGAGATAQIGNSGSVDVAVAGDVSVVAGDAVEITGLPAIIGNINSGGAESGNVVISAQSLTGDIEPIIANDLPGGDFALALTGDDSLTLSSDLNYSSAHNLTLSNGGDIIFDASLQNSGTGNITINSGGDVTIGGSGAAGDVAVGSAGGTTSVTADNLLVSGINGYAQIGYHAGGSGSIDIVTNGDVSLMGGAQTGYYAQIGNGGYLTSGSNSGAITIDADGNITLDGGAGQEAYAQIGHGGAESNSNSEGYSNTGIITINGESVTLAAGSGTGAYTQIGHGGYKAGASLAGTANNMGNITINALNAVALTGNGAEAYAQIGNGGDLINVNAANGSGGTTSGDIIVAVAAAPSTTSDAVTMTAGGGTDSYVQIGNGGNGENTPVSGATVTFTISGNVTVSDLKLAGSNTGTDGYAQIGNGDSAHSGTGNVSGDTTIANNTNVTATDGTAPGTSAMIGNNTGTGTVTGDVSGYPNTPTVPTTSTEVAQTNGSIASVRQNLISWTDTSITIVTVTPEVGTQGPGDTGESTVSQGPTPLEKMADSDGSNSEGEQASDNLATSVGQSLTSGGHKGTVTITRTLIPGVLTQVVTVGSHNPHGIPPADEDYSSWGNEALWRW